VIGFEVIAQGGDPFFIGVAKLQVRATTAFPLVGNRGRPIVDEEHDE
jgi:hypothetical protein